MIFYEKLDFLMNITKTTNSELARKLALDPSYISRLRRGKRLLPKNENLIKDIADSLSQRFTQDYQKKALADTIGLKGLPGQINPLAEEITLWLLRDDTESLHYIKAFLNKLSGTKSKSPLPLRGDCQFPVTDRAVSIYYGVEGKRRAVEAFLCEVAAKKSPQTLLLYSDEEISWLTEDPAFLKRWSELMFLILSRGNKIKIIHNISRDLDEMLAAIINWMPLYMSGNIKPSFYPKKLDSVFKRTLFIAPETAAIISNSLDNQILVAANILYRDQNIIATFAEEFFNYLQLCRPLMEIFTLKDKNECLPAIINFEQEPSDVIIKTESLSLLTMPQELLGPIIQPPGPGYQGLRQFYEQRHKRFLEDLKLKRFDEIICLPDTEDIIKGKVKMSISDILSGKPIYYKPEEYIAHLEQIIYLLGNYPNYHIYFTHNREEGHHTVYVRENTGVIVAKTSQSPIILVMNENNLTIAFGDFLKSMIHTRAYTKRERSKAISRLREFLLKLKKACDEEKTD